MALKEINWHGLTDLEAENRLSSKEDQQVEVKKLSRRLTRITSVFLEPMFLLLLGAAVVYFALGEYLDGSMMLIFVLVIIGIELLQKRKTENTLKRLKELSEPFVQVIRENQLKTIPTEKLVVGDLMVITEGGKLPADGFVVKANDFKVNEASLTGESDAVCKVTTEAVSEEVGEGRKWRNDYCYTGTLVISGSGVILIDKIGVTTEYGKIGKHLGELTEESTGLEKQIKKIVTVSVMIAFALFVLVTSITYLRSESLLFKTRLIESVLGGITLAMALIPEEFPVVLIVFLSVGAWRLAKKQALVKKLSAIENMGAISVLCVDKTGTLTKNEMEVSELVSFGMTEKELVKNMKLACKSEPFDPMELAMVDYYQRNLPLENGQEQTLELIKEYPFKDDVKMMGNVWQRPGQLKVVSKGAPEMILSKAKLAQKEIQQLQAEIECLATQGLRVIAVAEMVVETIDELPATLHDCCFDVVGLIALVDPPKEGIKERLQECYQAGIKVVMITGDYSLTAQGIAEKVGIQKLGEAVVGEQLKVMSDSAVRDLVKERTIFSRVTPEEKLKIVKALRDNGEVVGMIGDGVNDAPALKCADIGIAMGKKGSDVSREVADLILMDDNFGTVLESIEDGRRIYDNLKKAIGYILVIHIPIALSALIAPLLGIPKMALFLLPIHVVLLELVIDPTCSVVLERQPSERDIMKRKPRKIQEKLLPKSLIIKSVVQGLVIFAVAFTSYYLILVDNIENDEKARTVGLVILIFANVFLVMSNSSQRSLGITTFIKMSKDKIVWLIMGGTIGLLLLLIYSPANSYFDLAPLTPQELLQASLLALGSVAWYDVFKLLRR